jgi:membrane fusion protein (multidrug efflux system)
MKTYQKVIVALLLCGIGLGSVMWLTKKKELPIEVAKEPTPVEAAKAKSGSILRRLSVVGTLKAVQSVVLHPQVNGKIAKVYFQEGEQIKEGEPLIKIEDAIYKAKVKEAEARLALNREEYKRAIKLLEKNFGTIQMRDKSLADVQVAEANLEEAKVHLDNTVIKAPFEGVMGLKEVSVGTLVSESTELATIVDLDPINVDFHIAESYLPFVHKGDIVDVTVEDFDILPIEATIIAISPQIDEATRTVSLRAQMSNKELAYRPGEFARVLVLAGKSEDTVLISQTGIERESGSGGADAEEYVMLVEDGVAVRKTVSTGMRDGDEVEITHGIKADDLVITAGQFKVRDGEEVTVVNQLKEEEQ